jgi:hypothetical protein
MAKPNFPDDLEIAPGHTVGCWKKLKLNLDAPNCADWQKAIDILDARIRCRFFNPVDELLRFEESRSPKMFGFAILAIDFLVIETLQGFREGVTDHTGKSERLFTNFLTQWAAFSACLTGNNKSVEYAKSVYKAYRCALHHSGATDGAFRVGVSGPMVAFTTDSEVKINRTCLHKKLKREFDGYLVDLSKTDNNELRRNFKIKMNSICGVKT